MTLHLDPAASRMHESRRVADPDKKEAHFLFGTLTTGGNVIVHERISKPRRAEAAPAPSSLASADYSRMETRIMATYAGAAPPLPPDCKHTRTITDPSDGSRHCANCGIELTGE